MVRERAIVTDIAGTNAVLKEHIHIDGMPLHIIDTAGLRDAPDEVERIGIQRAWDEISKADRILLMIDSTTDETDPEKLLHALYDERGLEQQTDDLLASGRVTVIRNKADLSTENIGLDTTEGSNANYPTITLSAKQNAGVDTLREHLKDVMGYNAANEGGFQPAAAILMPLTVQRRPRLRPPTARRYGRRRTARRRLRGLNALNEITGALPR